MPGPGGETTVRHPGATPSRSWGDAVEDEPVDLDRVQRLVGERYRIERLAGTGGMSHVFAAMDLKRQRRVAVKVLRRGVDESEGEVRARHRRLIAEARAVSVVSHPCVCAVHEVGMNPLSPHLVMDWVEGVGLREYTRGLGLEERLAVFARMLDALAGVHGAGVIHGDIKPGNVIVRPGGEPVLLDFGLAQTEPGSASSRGAAGGTPGYSAPEQFVPNAEVGPRSDVFALGVVLFELLTDELPFRVGSVAGVLARMERLDPPVPRDLNPAVPERVQRVCLTAMSRERARRYASAGEMREDLLRVLGGVEPRGRGGVLRELYADELVGTRDRVLYWLGRGELGTARAVDALGWIARAGRREPRVPLLVRSVLWAGVMLWSGAVLVGGHAGLVGASRGASAGPPALGDAIGSGAVGVSALGAMALACVMLWRAPSASWSRSARAAVTAGGALSGLGAGAALVAGASMLGARSGVDTPAEVWLTGPAVGVALGLLASVLARWRRPTIAASGALLLAMMVLWVLVYLWFAIESAPLGATAGATRGGAEFLGLVLAELRDPRLGAWVAALGAVLAGPAVELDRARRRTLIDRGRAAPVNDAWLWLWGAAGLTTAGLAHASVVGSGWIGALLRLPLEDERPRSAFVAGLLLLLISVVFGSRDASARRAVTATLRSVGMGAVLAVVLVEAWSARPGGDVRWGLAGLGLALLIAWIGTLRVLRPSCWVGVAGVGVGAAFLVRALVADRATGAMSSVPMVWAAVGIGMALGLGAMCTSAMMPSWRASRRLRLARARLRTHHPEALTGDAPRPPGPPGQAGPAGAGGRSGRRGAIAPDEDPPTATAPPG